ncbi:hypothetical protein DW322_11580 [Rhodococcus rhodnii]|uniref:Uncharacterized protein n=2 Tax=Rhodococcus rhodnii TaxID=38312 RepID=R7WLU6_9NOCA|nr:hypothetical protein [Rhodococcus rhodnii]EOM76268.1 hypothetical protein Rrhod_2368 [Rhodococcus rhodnii LMG 5362]TXG90745.1 hypothetical protein DW322_11580 [Rhodococcus rhodnii]
MMQRDSLGRPWHSDFVTVLANAADSAPANTAIQFAFWVLLILGFAALGLFPVHHRLKVWYRRKTAAPTDIQKSRISELFNGRSIVTVDPRNYTISVAEMNAIANSFGYYYIGETGYTFGSVKVAFQMLPSPPSPRLPTLRHRWSAYPTQLR